jgi:hypothetical protein
MSAPAPESGSSVGATRVSYEGVHVDVVRTLDTPAPARRVSFAVLGRTSLGEFCN